MLIGMKERTNMPISVCLMHSNIIPINMKILVNTWRESANMPCQVVAGNRSFAACLTSAEGQKLE
jgi:hypothetical protein